MSPLKKVEPLEPIPPFFFEDYWPLLKIAQLIGAFPYKKITKENGAVQLRSLNIVLSFLIHMVLCVIPFFLMVSPLIYEGTYEILLKNVLEKISEVVSVTSTVVYQFVWNPMFLIFSNLILWKTYIMRADEATLTLSGLVKMKRYQQIQQKWRKKILAFCMILSVIGSFLSYMGAYAILFEIKLIPKLFDIKIILISLLMAILTPLGIMSPILTTLIMAFQASLWIRQAVFDLKISPIRGFTFEWIIEVNSLLKALTVISKWLGVQLLLTVLLKATLFVVTVYMAVDSTSMTQSYVKVFLIGGFIVWALEALTILIILNLASEGVIEDVQDLKKIMEIMEATDKIEVEFEGKFLAQTYIRSLMVNELESFKGFDLHGFSKLGKPLLCSIFGMSLTYLIVLMQFRISEQ